MSNIKVLQQLYQWADAQNYQFGRWLEDYDRGKQFSLVENLFGVEGNSANLASVFFIAAVFVTLPFTVVALLGLFGSRLPLQFTLLVADKGLSLAGVKRPRAIPPLQWSQQCAELPASYRSLTAVWYRVWYQSNASPRFLLRLNCMRLALSVLLWGVFQGLMGGKDVPPHPSLKERTMGKGKFVGLGFLAVALFGCLGAPSPTDDNTTVAQLSYPFQGVPQGTLSYYQSHGSGRGLVVFIHGTPGDAGAFTDYLVSGRLTTEASLVMSIDRPGWGLSTLNADQSVLNLADQSELLRQWFVDLKQRYPEQPLVLVGHSLGASLIAQILTDDAKAADAVLLLAGGFDPALSEPRWYNQLAKTWLVKSLMGDMWRKSNQEMLWLQADLQRMASYYQGILTPMTIIQGRRDKLVNPDHLHSAERYWPHARFIELEKSGHFLPWQQQPLIEQEIVTLLRHTPPE